MRILLATDGSEPARAAAEWIRHFRFPATAEVLVVTVAVPAPATLDVVEAPQGEVRDVAEAARRALAERWPEVEARTVEGDPQTAILQMASEWRADLVVLGARGLGAFAGLLLGSVSLGVARHTACPVLITKGPPRPVRTALIAVDGSPDSLAAARFCASLPLEPALRVRLLAVAEPPRFPSSAPGAIRSQLRTASQDILRERTAEMEDVLRATEGELGARPTPVERVVVVGSPGEAIVEAARTTGADLVVVGARGLGMFGRLLLGSVSEQVLRHAPCPVLLVKKVAHP
jgi:nucleotide-binding universal stress UspA family protein